MCKTDEECLVYWDPHTHLSYTTSVSSPQESWLTYFECEYDAANVLPLLWPLPLAAFPLCYTPGCVFLSLVEVLQSSECYPPVSEPGRCFHITIYWTLPQSETTNFHEWFYCGLFLISILVMITNWWSPSIHNSSYHDWNNDQKVWEEKVGSIEVTAIVQEQDKGVTLPRRWECLV